MNHEEHITLLARCRPLATKLIQQGFAYEYIPEDGELLAIFEQSAEAVNADKSVTDNALEVIVQAAGLSPDAMMWLVALREIGHEVRARGVSFRPFAERLRRLENGIQMHLMMGILDAGEDAEFLTLPDLARTNPFGLIQAERRWHAFITETFPEEDTVDVSPTPVPTRTQHHSVVAFSEALPSRMTRMPWLSAHHEPRSPSIEKESARRGHWRIYVARERVDALWTTIAQAVTQGQLGPSARVSTLLGSAKLHHQEHRICVYASDSFDTEEVKRLRDVLRNLGVTWPISYKLHGKRPEHAPSPVPGHDAFTLYVE